MKATSSSPHLLEGPPATIGPGSHRRAAGSRHISHILTESLIIQYSFTSAKSPFPFQKIQEPQGETGKNLHKPNARCNLLLLMTLCFFPDWARETGQGGKKKNGKSGEDLFSARLPLPVPCSQQTLAPLAEGSSSVNGANGVFVCEMLQPFFSGR